MPRIQVPYNWGPRDYQRPCWDFFEKGGKRGLIVWHRRAGKDTMCMNLTVTKSIERIGLYWHVFPTYNQGRKILWNGMTGDGRRFLDFWPQELVTRQRDDDMYMELANGSAWQVVGAEDPDRLVGNNPVGVIMSEYSLQNPATWELIRPILAENEGWALFNFTPRGRNHGYKLLQRVKALPPDYDERGRVSRGWFCQVLTVDDTKKLVTLPDGKIEERPVISPEAIQEDRDSGMEEAKVQQEYWCSFDAALEGSYYGAAMQAARKAGRVTRVSHEPNLEVHTMWDLGVDDKNAIWFFQILGREIRFIHYYENTGQGLPHYASYLKRMAMERNYTYGKHYGPHDLSVKEYGSGKTRVETAKALGIKFEVVSKHTLEDGIDYTRSFLNRCWWDETECETGIEALEQYQKTYDEKNDVYHNTPLHNFACHGADALRTGAWGLRDKGNNQNLPPVADNSYNPLSGTDAHDMMRDRPAFADDQYDMFGG